MAVTSVDNMNSLTVNLAIPAEEFVRLYQGNVKVVIAKSIDGRQVKFPADILRPFVLHQGVYGQFRIHFDELHKFKSIEKL
jgi:Protein of unknown function (DUF2835)